MATAKTGKPWGRRLYRWLLLPWGLLIAAGTLLLLVVYQPSIYQPRILTEEQQKRAEQQGWKKSQEFYNNVHRLERFSIKFEEDMLNRLLMHDHVHRFIEKMSPVSKNSFRDIQLHIDDETIHIMGEIKYKNVPAVLDVRIGLSMTKEGRLELKLLPVKTGLLSLPSSLTRNYLKDLLAFLEKRKVYHGEKKFPHELIKQIVPLLSELIEKDSVTWEPVFRAVEDKRARVVGFEINSGSVELELEPLPIEQ